MIFIYLIRPIKSHIRKSCFCWHLWLMQVRSTLDVYDTSVDEWILWLEPRCLEIFSKASQSSKFSNHKRSETKIFPPMSSSILAVGLFRLRFGLIKTVKTSGDLLSSQQLSRGTNFVKNSFSVSTNKVITNWLIDKFTF